MLLGTEGLRFHQMTDRKRNHLCLKKFHEFGTLLKFKGQWIFTL